MRVISLACSIFAFLGIFVKSVTLADDATEVQSAILPLAIIVKEASNSAKDARLHLTIELTNNSKSVLSFVAPEKLPFKVWILDQQGKIVNSESIKLPSTKRGRVGTPVLFKPLEKKIYSFSYPKSPIELPTGKYDVIAAVALLSYKIGEREINLEMPKTIKSPEISIALKKNQSASQKEISENPLEADEVVVSVTPYSITWSLGEPMQPKTLRIEVTPPTALVVQKAHIDNPQFASRLQESGKAGVYSLEVLPPSTKMPTQATLFLESRSDVLLGYEVNLSVGSFVKESGDGIEKTVKSLSPPLSLSIEHPREVAVNQLAPEFKVLDMNGKVQQLNDYRGKSNLLLTFFPKCFTGGCANHLSSLRDQYAIFEANDTKILAISVDPADGEKGQKAFAKQWELPFPLIPDTDRKLSLLYGAVDKPTDLDRRMTVLIDKQGIVRFVDTNVNVQTHGADMIVKMRDLGMIK